MAQDFLRAVRSLIDALQISPEEAVEMARVPDESRASVITKIRAEDVIQGRDVTLVEDRDRDHDIWLPNVDRASWYYWPRLRSYLIDKKGWPQPTVRSIDDATDRILGAMESPDRGEFNTRGLVVGYVQSGKTANYSALIAKAADSGYKLIIILSGIHNSLRYQTQVRLDNELVGIKNGASSGVGRPDPDHAWHTFTSADINQGDFSPGNASPTALSGTNPILLVVKKNGPILNRLNFWLSQTHESTLRTIACLVIDDEADQASVNTGGNRPVDADPDESDPESSPSRINEHIRSLLSKFQKVAYVGYTATPFANVLIDHTSVDRIVREDLYPSSFIVSLPRPYGYFGASEMFGLSETGNEGLDVIRMVDESEITFLVPSHRSLVDSFQPTIPGSLKLAMLDFVLAGAGRAQRGQMDEPATMLVHTSYRTTIQARLTELIEQEFAKMRDEWRYFRMQHIERYRARWEDEFRPVTRSIDMTRDRPFGEIVAYISPFMEHVLIKQINSGSEDELDYDRDRDLKCIVIGGNRLSRGLTLEGLLISYFVRHSSTYDTLMQMGRWFGYREGWVDLTRLYTTKTLRENFTDLAVVEDEMHREIARYEHEQVTPLEVGVKIRTHSSMLITSPLKMRSANTVDVSFSNNAIQTITFPLHDNVWLQRNVEVTRGFLSALDRPSSMRGSSQPMWNAVTSELVLEFLSQYLTDEFATRANSDSIRRYILRQNELARPELTSWTIAVCGLKKKEERLGTINLGIGGCREINLIERTRVKDTNSLKAIMSPSDHEIGLSEEQLGAIGGSEYSKFTRMEALRRVRPPSEGLLLVYPIGRYSGHGAELHQTRARLFGAPSSAVDIIGLAFVFPYSRSAAAVEYVVNSVGVGNVGGTVDN